MPYWRLGWTSTSNPAKAQDPPRTIDIAYIDLHVTRQKHEQSTEVVRPNGFNMSISCRDLCKFTWGYLHQIQYRPFPGYQNYQCFPSFSTPTPKYQNCISFPNRSLYSMLQDNGLPDCLVYVPRPDTRAAAQAYGKVSHF